MPFERALVFGEFAHSSLIGKQFKAEGFEVSSSPPDSDPDLLIQFKKQSGGKGYVHPGATLLAESPEFASKVQELGLTWVGPSIRALTFFRNRLHFLVAAEKRGIPHLAVTLEPLHSSREIVDLARRTGQSFPFVLRSVKRAGSFGAFLVQDSISLERSLAIWLEQLRWHSGEVIFFLERLIDGARQVVLPFARFQNGDISFFPPSDASLQCRFRKVIEFCPAFSIDPPVLECLKTWSKQMAEASGFVGVGAFEFLVDGSRAFLIDGMPRLNTHFHLWEKVGGINAVQWQLATLKKKSRPKDLKPGALRGHGIAVRMDAEDSLLHFPSVGRVEEVSGQGEEALLNYQAHQEVPLQGSGILGLMTVLRETRSQCVDAARKILNRLWISGSLKTNERFLGELLDHPWIKEGVFHSTFVDDEFIPSRKPPEEMVRAFAEVCARLDAGQRWVVGEQWLIHLSSESLVIEWKSEPRIWEDSDGQKGLSGELFLSKIRLSLRVGAYPVRDRWIVRLGSWFQTVRKAAPALQTKKKVPKLHSLVPGRVQALFFRPGALVEKNEPLVILESQGVFVPHALSIPVKVVDWKVGPGQSVLWGEELAELEFLNP